MSGSDIANNSGFTGCLNAAGLIIGSTSTGIGWAAPNGAGVDYAIDGIGYHLADDATIAINATVTQAVSTSCLYLVMFDSAGVMTIKKGVERLTADLGDNLSIEWPQPDTDTCPIGGFKIATNASTTFTSGTTALDAAGITDTFFSFAGGIPLKPEVS